MRTRRSRGSFSFIVSPSQTFPNRRLPPRLCTSPSPPTSKAESKRARNLALTNAVSIISSCTTADELPTASHVFSEFLDTHQPHPVLLSAYVRTLCRHGKLSLAREALSAFSWCATPHSSAALISAVCRLEGADAGLAELMHAQRHDTASCHAYTAVIHCLGVADRPSDAYRVLQHAESNTTPDAPLYTACIRAYARARQVNDAFAVLQRMQRRGIAPNSQTFQGLILACATPKMAGRALVVYRAACEQDMVDWGVCSATASAVLVGGLWKHRLVGDLVARMERETELAASENQRVAFKTKLDDLKRLRGKDRAGEGTS